MKKPRLSSKVLRGLGTMAGVAEAGTGADFLGLSPAENNRSNPDWDDVLRACEWIRSMQRWDDSRRCSECDMYFIKCPVCLRVVGLPDDTKGPSE